jgi:hypothetical protein
VATDPWAAFNPQPAPPSPFGNRPVIRQQPDPYKARDQELQEAAAQRAEEDQKFQRQKFEREMNKPDGELGVAQSKAAGFLSRAEKANKAYETTGVGPQSTLTTAVRAVTPETLEPLVIGPDRQQAEANIRGFISSVLRYESGAAIPPEEFDSAFKTYFPQPNEDAATVEAKKQLRAQAIEAIRLGVGQQPAPEAQPVVHPDTGETLAPATTAKQVDDPNLTGLKGEYLRRLQAGQPPAQLFAWMKQAGVPLDKQFMQSVVEQVKFRKANPNVPVDQYNISAFDDRFVPTSGFQQTMTDASQTALGAGAMQAANAVTGNNLDSIVGMTGGNPEQVNIALGDASRQHPVASLAGGLSGGVSAALGGEAALGGMGMAPGFMRALTADSAYGTVAGAGADDENRLRGAGTGLAFGAGGSIAGQGIMRGTANAISPSGGRLNALYESGVRPTPGQRFVETGTLGRAINATEEGLSSVPIVGSAIRGARQEARDQFQLGAFNESLKEIGLKLPKSMGPGTKPHAFAQQAFDAAYNKARSGLKVRGDDEMAKEVAGLGEQISTLAKPSAQRFYTILENLVMRRISKDGGELSGEAYKNVQKDLGKTIRGIRKNKSGDDELADALEDLQHILDGGARRHSTPEAVKALDDADRGYAKFVRIMDASKRAGGDPGTFTPTQFDRSVQANSRGRRSEEYLRGDALMQDYAEQGKSLVDRMPNSGTADRAMLGLAGAGAAGTIEPTSLTLLGALGAAYAPGVRKLTTGTMKPRPKTKPLADAVRKRARIAGASGAVLGTSHDQ